MLIISLALVVCIVGVLLYLKAINTRVMEVGRIMFWTGLVFVLWFGSPLVVHGRL